MKRIKVKSSRITALSLLLGLSLVGLSLTLARPAVVTAAAVPVTNTDDSGPGSLRAGISSAQSGDQIVFSLPANSTIMLTSGELLINTNLTIDGASTSGLTVQRSTAIGTPDFRIFNIASGNFNVTISGLTISNGKAAGDIGGGILNQSTGTLNVTNSTISNNSATDGSGAGIFNSSGTLTITNSTLSGNSAPGGLGGGIFNSSSIGTLTITNSTISGNSAHTDG